MSTARVSLLIFLLVTLSGCNYVARQRQMKTLLSDANKLMARDTDVTEKWGKEVATAFTPEKRAQFPANRDFMRTHATQIIKLLDESSSLNNSAAEKYEQVAVLSRSDKHRRGFALFASSFRKTVEMNELLKSQMQTVFDKTIVDEKTFNQKYSQTWEPLQQKRREVDQDIQDGRRLLGW